MSRRTTPKKVMIDEAVLEQMVEHIAYEIEMLQATTQLMQIGRYRAVGGTPEERILANAILESALIHARSLDKFFSAHQHSQPGDVIARDFLPTWPLRTVLSQKQRDRVSKRLAHLTTARTAGPEPWELDAGVAVLVTAKEFLDRLATEQPLRARWFRRWIGV